MCKLTLLCTLLGFATDTTPLLATIIKKKKNWVMHETIYLGLNILENILKITMDIFIPQFWEHQIRNKYFYHSHI